MFSGHCPESISDAFPRYKTQTSKFAYKSRIQIFIRLLFYLNGYVMVTVLFNLDVQICGSTDSATLGGTGIWKSCTIPICCPTLNRNCTLLCSQIMSKVMIDLTSVFEAQRFTFFSCFGTLLGIVREKSVIPHPYSADIDIAMAKSDITALFDSKSGLKLRKMLSGKGYTLFWERGKRICLNRNWTLQAQDVGQPWPLVKNPSEIFDKTRYVDIYPMSVHGVEVHFKGAVYPRRELFPIKIKSFRQDGYNVRAHIPAQSRTLLRYWYGNWTRRIVQPHGCNPPGSEKCLNRWKEATEGQLDNKLLLHS